MQLTVNGSPRAEEEPCTILQLLQRYGLHQKMVVVELNGTITDRTRYGEVALKESDTLEIVQMMAGG